MLFVQNRLLTQCIPFSTYVVCLHNSKVSLSEKRIIHSKLITTSQEIICITHDDSDRFQNTEKL